MRSSGLSKWAAAASGSCSFASPFIFSHHFMPDSNARGLLEKERTDCANQDWAACTNKGFPGLQAS
eukprot:1159208-Pelagomonas_calceolata.AAC.8